MIQDIFDHGKNFGLDWPSPKKPIYFMANGKSVSMKPSDITNEQIEKFFDEYNGRFPITHSILSRLYFNRMVDNFKFGR